MNEDYIVNLYFFVLTKFNIKKTNHNIDLIFM